MSGETPTPTMTKGERDDLARLTRKHERLEKQRIEERKAELRAEFERQLNTYYPWDSDETWAEVKMECQRVIDEGQRRVAARCEQLGIPERFRPSINFHWSDGRIQYASASERADIRRAFDRRVEALASRARTTIERKSFEVQTRLVADGLTSEAAKAFLGELPTATALLQPLDPEEVRKLLPRSAVEETAQ